MKKQKGFSLIELLIVVAIILIIAAIAIPNLLKSRMAANESSAVGSVRTINTGQVTYSVSCPATGFAAALVDLNTGGPCVAGAGIIDQVLGGGAKSGYTFLLANVTAVNAVNVTYDVTAIPMSIGTTGQREFCSDQTGVIRYTLNGAGCTVASLALQ